MSLRFRRSVRLFPGVRLNFSRSGISTTVGVRGATMTLGPRGTYANVGIPGSGLSYRTRISPPPGPQAGASNQPSMSGPEALSPSSQFLDAEVIQIQSADVSVLTSTGLSELKKLINEAAVRRRSLTVEVKNKQQKLANAAFKLRLSRLFVVRIFTQRAIPKLILRREEADRDLEFSRAELEGCVIEVDFGLNDTALASYAALTRSFEALSRSRMIWDITGVRATNRVAERTTATIQVTRIPVRFDRSESVIIKSEFQSLRLGNASGRSIQIFPGFVMMTEPAGDFALLEFGEVRLEAGSTRFIEEERVPDDALVVGQTWKKANKDGSADRRFKNNYHIPIVEYGEIYMRSPTGLLEAYDFSNLEATTAFGQGFAKHQNVLSNSISPVSSPEKPQMDVITDDEGGSTDRDESLIAVHNDAAPNLVVDWIALGLMIIALVAGLVWVHHTGMM